MVPSARMRCSLPLAVPLSLLTPSPLLSSHRRRSFTPYNTARARPSYLRATRSAGSHLFRAFSSFSCVCSARALYISQMPLSTLHPGVRAASAARTASPLPQHVQPQAVVSNLGEGGGATPAAVGAPKHCYRSFKDAMEVVKKMTGRRPNKCPDAFETTKRYLDRLGFAPILERIRFVHVAGTKGKGTTSAYIAALLQAYGFKVGLFTSPHLTDLRERTVVDGRLLDESTYAQHFFEFLDKYEGLQYSDSQLDRDISSPSQANFFRFIFLLSLYIFEQEGVEVAVMEAGIGGRIDSTNTIPSEVSIITSLGYDHMEILGNTIQEIAAEKSGIMKPGVVCFAAPQRDHPETRAVLEKHAREVGTPLVLLDQNVLPIQSWPKLAIGGVHAVENSKLALMAARRVASIPPILPLDEVEKSVLQGMTYAGRSQIAAVDSGANITFYLDGAHTVESISSATQWFLDVSAANTRDPSPRRVLMLYTSRDPKSILKAFMPYVSYFCKVVIAQVSNPRMTSHSADPTDIEGKMSELRERMVATTECWRSMYREVTCLPCARPFSALEDILELVVPAASDNEDASKPAQVFVCGSFFLVGDVVQLLKVYEAGRRRLE
ncbi:folylpolyglutamate_synthetase [Leishmania braziliensis MHOM/BR/75/M2904]|nr:folylpolyglutamate_synthetase [Leishmania braziliensis MHOM/BR/75/M2904]